MTIGQTIQPRGFSNNIKRLVAGLVVACLLGPASSQEFQQTTTDCTESPGTVGYATIEAMNTDMMQEVALIIGGKTPQETYRFVLCPNTVIDASSTTLTPLLDGSIFLCGETGSLEGACEISGGAMQVDIGVPMAGSPQIASVSFMGITFGGFTEAAISGDAGSNTTVTLSQSSFAVRTTLKMLCYLVRN
jgi:hypothetical protein